MIDYIYKIVNNFDPKKKLYVFNRIISDFYNKFPFYCNINDNISNELIKYPNCFIDNKLYLGTGNQASDKLIVKTLNITHIINVTSHIDMPFKNNENDNKIEDNINIKYYNIPIEDNNNIENFIKRFIFICIK